MTVSYLSGERVDLVLRKIVIIINKRHAFGSDKGVGRGINCAFQSFPPPSSFFPTT